MRMLSERIDDEPFLRLIKKWLKAGVLDTDGQVLRPKSGTPQGGIISPVLANVYLHYALDLWFERVFQRSCKGAAFLHRYADDFVCGFGRAEEAERFYNELEARLRKFGLELAPDKTRVIPFSRHRQGETSFEFLGFEFRWGVNRKGQAWLKRRTARKRFRNSLKRVTEWCRQNRHRHIREQVQLLNAKLRGYKNYYGVHGNSASLDEFFYQVRRIHQRWLNQRSQRHSYTWAAYNELRKPKLRVRQRTKLLSDPRTLLGALIISFSHVEKILAVLSFPSQKSCEDCPLWATTCGFQQLRACYYLLNLGEHVPKRLNQ